MASANPAMMQLTYGVTPAQILDVALGGMPYTDAAFTGFGALHAALFTNGVAAGFPIDRGAVFSANRIQTATDRNSPDGSGNTGISFVLQPSDIGITDAPVKVSWCSCDAAGYDFGQLMTPGNTSPNYDVNLGPGNSVPMPTGSLPGDTPGQYAPCRCRVDSQDFDFVTGGTSSLSMSFDGLDNSWIFVGQGERAPLPSTTITTAFTTVTATPTLSTFTLETTTIPVTTTETITPPAVQATVTQTETSTITLAASTTTIQAPEATKTLPACKQLRLEFEKDCCPFKICKHGSPRTYPKKQASKPKRFFSFGLERRQDPQPQPQELPAGPNDPPAVSTISGGTVYITSSRTSTTYAPTTTVFTSTSTVTEASTTVASETLPVATNYVDVTSTSTLTLTPAVATYTKAATTKTVTPACVPTTIPKFKCPKKARSQKAVRIAERNFLELWKHIAAPSAPDLIVKCDGNRTEMIY